MAKAQRNLKDLYDYFHAAPAALPITPDAQRELARADTQRKRKDRSPAERKGVLALENGNNDTVA